MSAPADTPFLVSRWDDGHATTLTPAERLLYRSNLLGSDRRITNFGGGSTSAELVGRDRVTGAEATVLWVKGSGGDLASMKLDGFATLSLDKLNALKALYRGPDHEDEMADLLPYCTFGLSPCAASADTPLHAYLPCQHVDHTHPDAVIAIAASKNSRELTLEIYGDTIGWLPWRRPDFELGLALERFVKQHPEARGVVLERHGLITWGDGARDCYETTIETINAAIAWFAEKVGSRPGFLGPRFRSPEPQVRRAVAARLMPEIRARIGRDEPKIGHLDDSPAILEFVNSEQLRQLAPLGTPCPDNILRTKIRPLIVEYNPNTATIDKAISRLDESVQDYRAGYKAYYERCKHAGSPTMRDPNPVVYLVPGIGMITFAPDKAAARIAGEVYRHTIEVMRGASMMDAYVGLPEREAFAIEYRPVEEAKLKRVPTRKSLTGRVALVTGGASAIGRATAMRLLDAGAAVVVADSDAAALGSISAELADAHGTDNVREIPMDAGDEEAAARALAETTLEYGGLGILVCNASVSASAPIEQTSLAKWSRDAEILAKGFIVPSREAFRAMKHQRLGGAIIFVASHEGPAASPHGHAFSAAAAAEINLVQSLAAEGADDGIRVNLVNAGAAASSNKRDGEHRLLRRDALPENVAEAVTFLASDLAAQSTGNIIDVGAGDGR